MGLCFIREAWLYVRDTQQRTEEQPEHLLKSHTFMFYLRDPERAFLKNICYFNIAVGLGKLWASFQIKEENVLHSHLPVLITFYTLLHCVLFYLCQHYLALKGYLLSFYSSFCLDYSTSFLGLSLGRCNWCGCPGPCSSLGRPCISYIM